MSTTRTARAACGLVCALYLCGSAAAQEKPSKEWRTASYHGVVVGTTSKKEVLLRLGKPFWEGSAADVSNATTLAYKVNDPVEGRLEVYLRHSVVLSMFLYPDAVVGKEDVIRIFGTDFLLARYSMDDCPGENEGSGPIYEDPKGSFTRMEYRSRGITVSLDPIRVGAILYLNKPHYGSHPHCRNSR